MCSGYSKLFIAHFVLQQFVWSYLGPAVEIRLLGSRYLVGKRYVSAFSVLHLPLLFWLHLIFWKATNKLLAILQFHNFSAKREGSNWLMGATCCHFLLPSSSFPPLLFPSPNQSRLVQKRSSIQVPHFSFVLQQWVHDDPLASVVACSGWCTYRFSLQVGWLFFCFFFPQNLHSVILVFILSRQRGSCLCYW